eukprot:m.48993 g.48993  ORF g.48993 m.48993 type:complete len:415 (-) comp6073_c1_seq2:124-1368(-)
MEVSRHAVPRWMCWRCSGDALAVHTPVGGVVVDFADLQPGDCADKRSQLALAVHMAVALEYHWLLSDTSTGGRDSTRGCRQLPRHKDVRLGKTAARLGTLLRCPGVDEDAPPDARDPGQLLDRTAPTPGRREVVQHGDREDRVADPVAQRDRHVVADKHLVALACTDVDEAFASVRPDHVVPWAEVFAVAATDVADKRPSWEGLEKLIDAGPCGVSRQVPVCRDGVIHGVHMQPLDVRGHERCQPIEPSIQVDRLDIRLHGARRRGGRGHQLRHCQHNASLIRGHGAVGHGRRRIVQHTRACGQQADAREHVAARADKLHYGVPGQRNHHDRAGQIAAGNARCDPRAGLQHVNDTYVRRGDPWRRGRVHGQQRCRNRADGYNCTAGAVQAVPKTERIVCLALGVHLVACNHVRS